MTDALPSDFGHEDGWNDESGHEECPVCGLTMGTENGYHEDVYDKHGRHYEFFLNTDAGDGPFFCPDCWPQLEANKKASENQTLADFVSGDQNATL